jgi:hypothetical protein
MTYKLVTAAPVIVPAAYASGDAIGGLLTFEDVCSPFEPSFRIVSGLLSDNAKQSALVRLVLFDRAFTPTTDNSPFDPSDADLLNCIGYVAWAAADYAAFNDNSFAQKGGDLGALLGITGRLVDGGTSLFGQLVSYGTPTYVAADDVTIRLLIER